MLSTALTRRPHHGLTSKGQANDPFWNFFDRFFDDSFFTPATLGELAPTQRNWAPPVDIFEQEDAFVATADLPGLGKDDIDVSLEANVLTISGERSFEKETDGSFRRVERAYGTFRRSFTLPTGIDTTKVEATFADGVLTLKMPKSETAKSRKINIG